MDYDEMRKARARALQSDSDNQIIEIWEDWRTSMLKNEEFYLLFRSMLYSGAIAEDYIQKVTNLLLQHERQKK